MPKLPFSGYPGSAHYQVHRDRYRLRYRFPEMADFRIETSRFRASRHEKRAFLEWARKFLTSGGVVPASWQTTAEADRGELKGLDQAITIAEAVRLYLEACPRESTTRPKWMRSLASQTIETRTRPMLQAFRDAFGGDRALRSVTGDEIARFIRALDGRKETKERALCPISALYTWALRQKHISGENPAHGIVIERAPGEQPHDGSRKYYSDEEFARLVHAARIDPLAQDAIYLCRYLAARPQDAVTLKWEHWRWDQLRVWVPRVKTKSSGVEGSWVDLHPRLAERFISHRGDEGFCLMHRGKRPNIVWPSKEELRARVAESSMRAVGKALGVSGVAVREYLKREPKPCDLDREALAQSISTRVSRLTKEAGLYEKGVQPLYVLRHTFACDSLRRGSAPAIVAQEMGISVDTLMRHYFHAIPRGDLDDRKANRWGLQREAVDSITVEEATDTADTVRRSG